MEGDLNKKYISKEDMTILKDYQICISLPPPIQVNCTLEKQNNMLAFYHICQAYFFIVPIPIHESDPMSRSEDALEGLQHVRIVFATIVLPVVPVVKQQYYGRGKWVKK